MKKLLIVFLIIVMLCMSCINEALDDRDKVAEVINHKYQVTLGKGLGYTIYYCDSYERLGNIYMLYDKDKELVVEITIADGYYCEIKRIKEGK